MHKPFNYFMDENILDTMGNGRSKLGFKTFWIAVVISSKLYDTLECRGRQTVSWRLTKIWRTRQLMMHNKATDDVTSQIWDGTIEARPSHIRHANTVLIEVVLYILIKLLRPSVPQRHTLAGRWLDFNTEGRGYETLFVQWVFQVCKSPGTGGNGAMWACRLHLS